MNRLPFLKMFPLAAVEGSVKRLMFPGLRFRVPVIVSPGFKTFKDAAPVTFPVTLPVRLAVIVPAAKLPELSRRTMALAVLAETAFDTTVAL